MNFGPQYRGALIVAPPGIIGAWGLELIRDVAASFSPPLEMQMLDRLDDPDLSTARDVVFATQFPSEAMLPIVEGGLLPVIVFVDAAIEAVSHQLKTTGCNFIDALRSTTCAAVLNPVLFQGVSTLVINRWERATVERILEQILAHIALELSAEKLKNLRKKYCSNLRSEDGLEKSLSKYVQGYRPPGNWRDHVTDEQASVVEQALAPLIGMMSGEKRVPITWPAALFLSGDRPNEKAPLVAEITGAARIIYYGPYLYVPAGSWELEIAVGFSKDAIGLTFTAGVFGPDLLAQARFRSSNTGLFRGTFKFKNSNFQNQLEVRFRNDEGAIEGKFGLAWVKFFYRGGLPSQTAE